MATQYYSPPNATDSQGIFEFFRYVNNVSDGGFFLVLTLVIWIITFIATKQYSSDRAFTYASFVCMVLSILLGVMNLINPQFMYLFMVLTAVGVVWLKLSDTP